MIATDFTKQFQPYTLDKFGLVRLPDIQIENIYKQQLGLDVNASHFDFLKHLAYKGYDDKKHLFNKNKYDQYLKQLQFELELVEELSFTDYFLLVWKVINKARELGAFIDYGRGSAAGCLIFWLLGITGVDPIDKGLYFARFISKVRAKKQIIDGVTYLQGDLAPDVDINLGGVREEIVNWLNEIYPDRICRISNIVTFTSKILIKDAYKTVENASEEEAKAVADMVEKHAGFVTDLKEMVDRSEEFKQWTDEHPATFRVALKLRDIIRQHSSHASGYLISYYPLLGFVPLELNKDNELTVGYDMNGASNFCIKLDLLGLTSNEIINDVLSHIDETIENIDLDTNPIVYNQFQEGTKLLKYGLYQISADFAYRVLTAVKPKNILELSDVNALARPGACDYLGAYVDNNAELPHEAFKDALKTTRNLCLDENTEIVTISNQQTKIKKIKDIIVGDLITSINESTFTEELKPVIGIYNNGQKECFEITTTCGKKIIATNNHPLLSESGWKQIKELHAGDIIASPKKLITDINIQRFEKICDYFNLSKHKKYTNINWVKIDSIRYVGIRNVFDLEIKDNHNFVANHLIVHNCLYQEQMMQMAMAIGFSPEEAELLRRVVGKKKVEEVPIWKDRIYQNCTKNGFESAVGDVLWKVLEDSARYSFNLSHSLSTSYLTALTVYLKYKHPLEFYCACLKVANKMPKPLEHIAEIQQELVYFGIKLFPPHLLKSDMNFKIDGNNIRFGLTSIKGVSDKTIEKINKFKNEHANKFEVFHAANEAGISIGVLSALVQAGALEGYGESRPRVVLEAQLWNLLTPREKKLALTYGPQFNYDLFTILNHLRTTHGDTNKPLIKESRINTIRKHYIPYKTIFEQNRKNILFANWFYERTLLGYAYSSTLRDVFLPVVSSLLYINEVNDQPHNTTVVFVGVITKTILARAKNEKKTKYFKLTIRDERGECTALAFNDLIDTIKFENNGVLPQENNIVIINGKRFNDAIFINRLSVQDHQIYMKLSDIKIIKSPEKN